jgi:hypothetical protein
MCAALGDGRGPGPGIPDDQSVEHETRNDQKVVVHTFVRQAEKIEHDGNYGDDDADPPYCGIRHRQGQDDHDDRHQHDHSRSKEHSLCCLHATHLTWHHIASEYAQYVSQ